MEGGLAAPRSWLGEGKLRQMAFSFAAIAIMASLGCCYMTLLVQGHRGTSNRDRRYRIHGIVWVLRRHTPGSR